MCFLSNMIVVYVLSQWSRPVKMMCCLLLQARLPARPLPPPARPVTANVAPAEHIAVEEPGMTATDQVRTQKFTLI